MAAYERAPDKTEVVSNIISVYSIYYLLCYIFPPPVSYLLKKPYEGELVYLVNQEF